MHREGYADLSTLHLNRGQRLNRVGPRGSAKSTNYSKAYPLWCACEAVEPFILLLSDTGEQAGTFLGAIKAELEGNEEIRKAYPAAFGVGPVWQADKIKLGNGVMIAARGAGGRIRGLTNGNRRPTLVVIDDANKKEDVYSPTMRKRVLEWVQKDVMPVGEPGHTNFISVGTAIHREAVVCDLETYPTWKTVKYRAIEKWPDRMDLWAKWETTLSNLGDESRVESAAAFYESHRMEMDAGAVLLWPERFPLDFLMRELATIGRDAFECEYQDTPGTPGLTEWPPSYFDRPNLMFHDWPEDLIVKTYFLDPSKGRQDKPGDYQAHVWGGWSRKENALFVECDLRREPGPEMVARAIGHAVGFGCTEVTIEGNSDGVGLLYTEFQRALERRGAVVGLNTIHHTDPTLSRIRGLGPLLARGQIRIRNTPGGKMAVDQLRDVPSGEFDDACDAMAGLHRTIMAKLKGR
jgi:hypothetical protein